MFFSFHTLKDDGFDKVGFVQQLVVVGEIGPLVGDVVLSFPDCCEVNFNAGEIGLDLYQILLGEQDSVVNSIALD